VPRIVPSQRVSSLGSDIVFSSSGAVVNGT
jgi:hypothetical protein